MICECLSFSIDKIVNSLGMKMGYILKENMMPNPLDFVMVQAQKVTFIIFMQNHISFLTKILYFLIYLTLLDFYLNIFLIQFKCIQYNKVLYSKMKDCNLFFFNHIHLKFWCLYFSVIQTQINTYWNNLFPCCNTTIVFSCIAFLPIFK